MKKAIVITDVTRMREGRVCVAGYDDAGNCIRPVLPPPGIHESMLYAHNRPIVFPFAKVAYDFQLPTPEPPHTEDVHYDPNSVRFVRTLDEEQKRDLLERTTFDNVHSIFDMPIEMGPGFFIYNCQGVRSLGTVRPKAIRKVIYEQDKWGKWKYRLGFVDGDSKLYWLAITDLTWRYNCDYQRFSSATSQKIVSTLTSQLKNTDVFLRIGLARGWEKYPDRCYLQITSVYTFPDYLNGKLFYDFVPN